MITSINTQLEAEDPPLTQIQCSKRKQTFEDLKINLQRVAFWANFAILFKMGFQ